jgi:hypothetical protein
LCQASDARFNRAQRKTNYVPRSFLFLLSYSPIRGRFMITLTLDEGALDMMLGGYP